MVIIGASWTSTSIFNLFVSTEFNEVNATGSFNFKAKKTGQTGGNGIKKVEKMVPLKCLGNFRELFKCL